jgi:Putative porin
MNASYFNDQKNTLRGLLIAVAALLATCAAAQVPGEAASSTSQPIVPAFNPADTLPLFYVQLADITRRQPADDTLPDAVFRTYDPARLSVIDWGTLGNVGASARPMLFEPRARAGFATGIVPFELYRQRPEDLRFYKHTKTFSEVTFERGATQRESNSATALSRTFAGGTVAAIDYRTINNLGQYRNQRTKHSTVNAGIWVPVSKRYEFFLLYSGNTFRQRDNGGIRYDEEPGGPFFNGPISLAVNLDDEDAKSVQNFRTGRFIQTLKFQTASGRTFAAQHTAAYSRESWKYSDPQSATANQTADSLFYGPFLTDRRGIRHYLEVRQVTNEVTISTTKSKKEGRPTDGFSAGLRHSIFWVRPDQRADSVVNNVFATGRFALTPNDRFGLVATGDLGLVGTSAGEYRLDGRILLGLGKAGVLEGRVLTQRRPADLIHTDLWVTQQRVWSQNFQKPVENTLSATYRLPLVGFTATGQTHVVANYLYFDQQGLPRQSNAVNVSQLILREDFRLWRIHSHNTVALQATTNPDVVRLPTWFAKSSLYVQGKIFKKQMLANAGVDVRTHSAFRPDSYQPVIGQFQLQDTLTQQPYLWLDAFLSVKLQSFRFYLRVENLASMWRPDQVWYQTAWHPQLYGGVPGGLRLGLTWRFFDSNQPDPNDVGGGGSNGPPTGVGSGGGRPRF